MDLGSPVRVDGVTQEEEGIWFPLKKFKFTSG
jgi:hypothetical protein